MPQLLSSIINIIIYKDDKNICLKKYTHFYFLPTLFLNLDNSVNNVHRLRKVSMDILDMILEGTVSQICYFRP